MTLQLAVAGSDEWVANWEQVSGRLHGAAITAATDDFDGIIAESVELGKSAAANGKPVMVPFDATGLSDLQSQCESTGSLLSLYQPLRTSPAILCVKNELHSGKLGQLGLVRLHRWSKDPAELACDIDVVLWLVNKTPTHVYAAGSGDVLQVHLGFDNDEMAVVDHAVVPNGEYFSLSVVAGDGSAYADDHHNMNVLFDGRGAAALTTSQGELFRSAAAADFASAIKSQTAAVPIEDAQRVTRVLQAITQSRESRQAIDLS